MWKDPIIDEIRKHRTEHAKKFNFDAKSIADDIKCREEINSKTKKKKTQSKSISK